MWRYHLIVIVIVLVAGGCGGENFATVALTGNVTVDGQPIADGSINFVPQATGQGPSATAPITDGKYQADVPAGPVRVYFQATRETGKMIDVFGKPQPERVNAIPPSYAGGVELEVAAETTRHDFELTSK